MAAWARRGGAAEAAQLWRRALAIAPYRADTRTMLRYLAPTAAPPARPTDAADAAAQLSSQPPLTPPPPPPPPSDARHGSDARVAELTVAVGGESGGGGGGGGGGAWAVAAARVFAAHGAVLLTGVLSEEACAGLRGLLREVAADSLATP
jgi:hypothetical protein